MIFVALAATALLAATDASATPAPTETAARPAAADAAQPQPKTRRVCYVDPAATGSRMARRICHLEVVKDDTQAPDAPKTEQK
jgi:hypothetical protein